METSLDKDIITEYNRLNVRLVNLNNSLKKDENNSEIQLEINELYKQLIPLCESAIRVYEGLLENDSLSDEYKQFIELKKKACEYNLGTYKRNL